MLLGAAIGGSMTVSWSAIALFVITTAIALLFGHSLGNHRLLVHRSFQCPRWLECGLVYCGTLVGIAGPLGLLRQHDLRDFAQRQPRCHDFLRHGQRAWRDAWWQLHCDLVLSRPPTIALETATTSNRFYQFLERSWMAQQVPWAILAYVAGG
jgi:stearoyl-CoA desaturase (delta-9 desaturase)